MNDSEIKKLLADETKRQASVINLIPSENYVSEDVLEALGSVFNNKYAEGYPRKRYYGGNAVVDEVEELCQQRALETFGLAGSEWAVNVQPLSGAPANLAIYLALAPLGGKIMGMELSHGGHLSHGHKVSITGKWFTQVTYGVAKETEMIDYDALMKLALEEKPDIIVAGFTAYPRIIDWQKFREIADACGAYLTADISHIAGLVVAGVHPSPFPFVDVVMTTTHKTLRGPRAALIFSRRDPADAGEPRDIPTKIDRAVFPGIQGGPHINQIAAVAVALKEAQSPEYKKYIEQVVKNAATLATRLQELGWRIVAGGTDTHLMLVDTMGQGIPGKEAEAKLEAAGIIVNKNTIPFDARSPFDPSGIRLGTPAETTRGKTEQDFIKIADDIDRILRA